MALSANAMAAHREASMAKSEQPSADTQPNPTSSDKPVQTDKKNSAELTDDELRQATGGAGSGGGGGAGKVHFTDL
jgi:hypothetical protein